MSSVLRQPILLRPQQDKWKSPFNLSCNNQTRPVPGGFLISLLHLILCHPPLCFSSLGNHWLHQLATYNTLHWPTQPCFLMSKGLIYPFTNSNLQCDPSVSILLQRSKISFRVPLIITKSLDFFVCLFLLSSNCQCWQNTRVCSGTDDFWSANPTPQHTLNSI